MSVRSLNDTEYDREGVLQIWRVCAKITCGSLAADQKQRKLNLFHISSFHLPIYLLFIVFMV